MHDAQQDPALTIAEAAAQLGVSADTVRRRIRRGELAAVQVVTPNGPAWRVTLGTAPSASSTLGSSAPSALPTLDGAPSSAAMRVEAPLLAQLLADTQAELVRTAAAAAMWQERCQTLSAQLAQSQRALPAPDSPVDAPERPIANGTAEPTQEPASTQKRAWWRFW
jgi:excisionase family DNA binding protein